ncbi:MAG: hypothetical protein HRT47_07015 [Candidatus Caenarcaniphilales bacterium]|nr:hypothetical protein [Candidatus Caenarcaniphilales bacterium]
MLVQSYRNLTNLFPRPGKKESEQNSDNEEDLSEKTSRRFLSELSHNPELNYIPPPNSLKSDYLQTGFFPPLLIHKIQDFDNTYLLRVVEDTLRDQTNEKNFEKFMLDDSKSEINLEFNKNIQMIPLEKDQRRKSLKFKLHNNCEIELKNFKLKKNSDKEFFTIEIPYQAKSKYQKIDDKFIFYVEPGLNFQDTSSLEKLIELSISKSQLEKIKQRNINKSKSNPYLIESNFLLKPKSFTLASEESNIEIITKDLKSINFDITKVKLSKEAVPKLLTEESEYKPGLFKHQLFIPVLFTMAGQQYSTTIYKDLD